MADAMREALERLYRWVDAGEGQRALYTGDHPMALAFAALAQQPAYVAFDLTLDEDEARTLRDGIGDGCVQSVRLQVGEGYSGYGFYVSSSEYPEDGSSLVCEMTKHTTPPAPAVPDEMSLDNWSAGPEYGDGENNGYIKGWNDCRAAMLAPAPEVKPTGADDDDPDEPCSACFVRGCNGECMEGCE